MNETSLIMALVDRRNAFMLALNALRRSSMGSIEDGSSISILKTKISYYELVLHDLLDGVFDGATSHVGNICERKIELELTSLQEKLLRFRETLSIHSAGNAAGL